MRATASHVWRLAHCTYWAREDAEWIRSEDSDASIDGTQTHALAAGVDVPNPTPRARALHRSYERWREDTGNHGVASRELVMAYDLATDTARVVESTGERDYSAKRPTEIIGTFDVVGADYVDDLKTGQPENAHVEQLLVGALCLARISGLPEVAAGFVFLREDTAWRQAYSFDAIDLDAFADWLRERDSATDGSSPTPGSHCRYCPAAAGCPATQQALARVVAETPAAPSPHRLPMHASQITSPEHAAWVYGQLRAVKQIESHVWGALRAYAEQSPIDLGNGRAWGRRTTRRETVNLTGPESISVLERCLGERWRDACSFEASQASIKRAVAGGPEPVARVLKRTLAELRAIGAVSSKETVTFDEYETAADSAAE